MFVNQLYLLRLPDIFTHTIANPSETGPSFNGNWPGVYSPFPHSSRVRDLQFQTNQGFSLFSCLPLLTIKSFLSHSIPSYSYRLPTLTIMIRKSLFNCHYNFISNWPIVPAHACLMYVQLETRISTTFSFRTSTLQPKFNWPVCLRRSMSRPASTDRTKQLACAICKKRFVTKFGKTNHIRLIPKICFQR